MKPAPTFLQSIIDSMKKIYITKVGRGVLERGGEGRKEKANLCHRIKRELALSL